VALPACPQHVLSLSTAVTDTLVRLGAGGRLAGIDEFSRIIPGAAAVPVLGKGSTLSREQVIARAIGPACTPVRPPPSWDRWTANSATPRPNWSSRACSQYPTPPDSSPSAANW
jgi:hypothetical protein